MCDLAVCYEQLRSEVLGGERNVRHSMGWSHFVRHGMLAWLQAQAVEPPEAPVMKGRQSVENTLPWPQDEVISVLAGMALGCFVEVTR